jgi:hypothetical protein
MLAWVAVFMPKKPARPEQMAPITNDRAISPLVFCSAPTMWFETPSRTATATTKIASTLYSAARKAIAPSATHFPMVFMRSLPASCFLTHAARM